MNTVKSLFQTVTGQHWGPASVITAAVIVIGALAGGVMAITNPHLYSFSTYQNNLVELAGGGGILAIGRGLHLGGILSSIGVTPTEEKAAIAGVRKLAAVIPAGTVQSDLTTAAADAESILEAPAQAPAGDGPTVATTPPAA